MLKNKIFTILLVLTLSLPVMAEFDFQDDISNNLETQTQQEQVVEQEKQEVSTIQYKQPVSRNKVAKKFLAAMCGVGISSILLFVLLSLYNKVRENVIQAAKEIPPKGETPLTTPETLTDAVKTFLDKTKWD